MIVVRISQSQNRFFPVLANMNPVSTGETPKSQAGCQYWAHLLRLGLHIPFHANHVTNNDFKQPLLPHLLVPCVPLVRKTFSRKVFQSFLHRTNAHVLVLKCPSLTATAKWPYACMDALTSPASLIACHSRSNDNRPHEACSQRRLNSPNR